MDRREKRLNPHPPLFVLGVHRSGTSVVTRVIEQLGFFVGAPNELIPARPDNPMGFYERIDVRGLNDRWLSACNRSWSCPGLPNSGVLSRTQTEHFLASAQKIASRLSEERVIALKDPRLCLSLKLWSEAFAREYNWILAYREPESTVSSLVSREGIQKAEARALWALYVEHLGAAVDKPPIATVNYDELLASPDLSIRELADSLSNAGYPIDSSRIQQAGIDVEPTLRHWNTESANVDWPAGYDPAFRALSVGRGDRPPWETWRSWFELAACALQTRRLVDQTERGAAQLRNKLAEANEKISMLQDGRAHSVSALAESEAAIAALRDIEADNAALRAELRSTRREALLTSWQESLTATPGADTPTIDSASVDSPKLSMLRLNRKPDGRFAATATSQIHWEVSLPAGPKALRLWIASEKGHSCRAYWAAKADEPRGFSPNHFEGVQLQPSRSPVPRMINLPYHALRSIRIDPTSKDDLIRLDRLEVVTAPAWLHNEDSVSRAWRGLELSSWLTRRVGVRLSRHGMVMQGANASIVLRSPNIGRRTATALVLEYASDFPVEVSPLWETQNGYRREPKQTSRLKPGESTVSLEWHGDRGCLLEFCVPSDQWSATLKSIRFMGG